jgi:hypothetical protein
MRVKDCLKAIDGELLSGMGDKVFRESIDTPRKTLSPIPESSSPSIAFKQSLTLISIT